MHDCLDSNSKIAAVGVQCSQVLILRLKINRGKLLMLCSNWGLAIQMRSQLGYRTLCRQLLKLLRVTSAP
jgi:hypothetical protein